MTNHPDAIVEFVGGPNDGIICDTRGYPQTAESVLAVFVCEVTSNGEKIGQEITGIPQHGVDALLGGMSNDAADAAGLTRQHVYRVAGSTVVDGRVRIKMEYVRAVDAPVKADAVGDAPMIDAMVMLVNRETGRIEGLGKQSFRVLPRTGEFIIRDVDETAQAYKVVAVHHPIRPATTAGDIYVVDSGTLLDHLRTLKAG